MQNIGTVEVAVGVLKNFFISKLTFLLTYLRKNFGKQNEFELFMFCKCKSDIKQTIRVNLRDKIGYICFVHSFQTELPMKIESYTKCAVRSQEPSSLQFFFFIKSCKICLLWQKVAQKEF